MRQLTEHKLNGLNESLEITVTDQPGAGGACHRYDITGFDTEKNPSATLPDGYKSSFSRTIILFQNGPIKEVGCVNGISQEALLVILIDRLRSFQAGTYACRDNAIALTHLEDALMWLQKRTRDRISRGVEGLNKA
jgi:hypothetical protein